MRRGRPTVALSVLVLLLAACSTITPQVAPSRSAAVAPQASGLAQANVQLTHVANLPNAIAMATRPSDSAIYLATQDGVVRKLLGGVFTTVLDIRSRVLFTGERGLLGITFNPTGDKLYVHFSRKPDGDTEVDEYPFVSGVANPAGMRVVLTQDQPQPNHNGGSLLFGPVDHLLYLALGDGGGANDDYPGYTSHLPGGNAQSINTMLGKIVRIDPTDPTPGVPNDGPGPGLSYTIPPGNPFVASAGLDEIWSFGLRNPYRMSFDRSNGDLWIGDVGQGLREEIDWVAAVDPTHPGGKSANFGWNRREGDVAGPDPTRSRTTNFGWGGRAANVGTGPGSLPFTEAVLATQHADAPFDPGDCAIIGGYVYRGAAIPDLVGAYVFTDLCDSRIQAFTLAGGTVTGLRTLSGGTPSSVSFGEDNAGELYVLSLASGVWRIDPA